MGNQTHSAQGRYLTAAMYQKDFINEQDKLVQYCGKDECVRIPQGITQIGGWAFSNDARIKEVILPEGVTVIHALAFEHCRNLQRIVLPQSLREIGHHAFYDCPSLTSINLHNGIQTLGAELFKGCRSLADKDGFLILRGILHQYFGDRTTVSIPEGISEISCAAFENCTCIRTAILPASLRIIGDRAFLGCRNLENIRIPRGVISVGEWAFANCKSLKHLLLPDTVNVLGKGLVQYAGQIQSVHILSGTIPLYNVFEDTGLSSYPLAESVQTQTYATGKTAAVLGFLLASEAEKEWFPEKAAQAARVYIRRYRKYFYPYLEEYDPVLPYMAKHKLIVPADIPALITKLKSPETVAALLQYSHDITNNL